MRKLALLAIAAAALVPVQAQAFGHCATEGGTTLSVADGTSPHALDEANDYGGTVFGSGSGSEPMADIYREGTDLIAAWLDRDPDTGTLRANAQVADLGTGVMINANFYIQWNYAGTDPDKAQRWASIRMKGYDTAYSYGYFGASTIPTSGGTFFTVGTTTGSVDVENDTLSVTLPADTDWGSPTVGATLFAVTAESRILLGSPEQLPQNPLGWRHGFVYPADIADSWCNAIVD
ncbi:MAG: hypothetical protein ACLGH3_10070 [Actinomycetota bacterium]